MFTVMNVLTVPGPLPAQRQNLLLRHLRASHEVFNPVVDPEGRRVGIELRAGGVTPFDAIGPAVHALAHAMREAGWQPPIELLELTVEPGATLTVVRGSQ